MYYNVIVSDEDYMDNQFYNQLVFHFLENKEKALKFVELIASISDYNVILKPIKDEQNE